MANKKKTIATTVKKTIKRNKQMDNESSTNKKENQVDLTSVNKTRRSSRLTKLSLASLKRPKDGIKRDDEGKFTSGSGGLNSFKKWNWKRAAPLVIIVALVGGFFVFQSFAYNLNDVPRVWRGDYMSVNQMTITRAYWELHKERPTVGELLRWPAEAKALHKPGQTSYNKTILWQIYNSWLEKMSF